MNRYQEPKYKIISREVEDKTEDITIEYFLANRQSGEEIPEDEPVIIFRARDCYAATILEEYARRLPNGIHKEAVSIRVAQFRNWAQAHPERMKEPDTELDSGWTTHGIPPT